MVPIGGIWNDGPWKLTTAEVDRLWVAMAAMHAAEPAVQGPELMANAFDFVIKTRPLFNGEEWTGSLHGGDWKVRARMVDHELVVEVIKPGR